MLNLGHDSGRSCIAAAQLSANALAWRCSTRLMVQPPKPPPGEPRADQAWQILCQFHHGVGLGATAFKVLAVAPVRLGISRPSSAMSPFISASQAATVRRFSLITWRARKSDFGSISLPHFSRSSRVASRRKGTPGRCFAITAHAGLGFPAACGVVASGNRVLHHGIGNDQRHVRRNGRQLVAQVAQSSSSAWSASPLAEMNWSMMPQLAPTNSFSERWHRRASTGPG